MPKIGEHLRVSRNKAALTQEKAVSLLPVELRTLQNYENNVTPCPDELVPIIAREYEDPALLFRVLQDGEIWRAILPAVPPAHLPQAACALLDAVLEMTEHQRELLKIVADGRIAAEERMAWTEMTMIVRRLLVAGLQLLEASSGGDA